MKLLLIGLILFCIGNNAFGQKLFSDQKVLDTVSYRFVYDVQAKVFENSNLRKSDEHWLDIGKKGISYYYSAWQMRNIQIHDSIRNIGGSMNDVFRVTYEQGVEPSNFFYFIFKNYPLPGQQTVDYASMDLFQYQEPMDLNWNFVEGDTIILNHPCQKAICNYHGKTWIAFYATDIPISDGPWKLSGLPGLILRAYDLSDSFLFNCVGIYQNVGGVIAMMRSNRKITTPQKVHETTREIEKDPNAYMKAKGQNVTTLDEKGRPINLGKILSNMAHYESYSSGDKK